MVAAERLGYADERIERTTLDSVKKLAPRSPTVFLLGTRAFAETPATLFLGTDPDHFLKFGPLIHFPLLHLVPRPMDERAALLRQHLAKANGLIFPSRFAVMCFMESLLEKEDARALHGKMILAVGPATETELRRAGISADGAATNLGGVESLRSRLGTNFSGRYLYPCSDASPQQQRIASLKAYGIELHPAVFYRNEEVPARPLPRLPFSRVLFTSTSTVDRYFRLYPEELKAKRSWLAVGPSTLRALEARKLDADVIED